MNRPAEAAKNIEITNTCKILSIHSFEFHFTVKRLIGTIKRGSLICNVAKPSGMLSVHKSPTMCQANSPTIEARRNLFVGDIN